MRAGEAAASRSTLVGIATVLAAGALWYVLTTVTGTISAARFPAPVEVWGALKQISLRGYADGRLHEHVLHSCRLVLLGFAAAVAAGVPLGLAMGWSRRTEAFVNPIFLLLRPIPPLAWIPLAIVWLGLGDAAKVLVIWFAAFVPSVINSYTGVRTIEPYLIEASRMLGVGRWRFVREVLVPGALPHIFSGLRLSLQASWTTLVAGELVGALRGLGAVLNASAQDIFPAMILVGMVFVGICGGAMTWLLGLVERRAAPWRAA
jgi:NitT/TauT family transport system permease protein/taurine transport system permease protein